MKSRLTRSVEIRTRKQITRTLVVIGVIFFILIIFGPSIIGELGNLMFSLKKEKVANSNYSVNFLDAPTLDDIPQAVGTDMIDISGTTSVKDAKIELLVNDTSYKNIDIDDDGKFIKRGIKLKDGENMLKARVVKGDKQSDFSDEYVVRFTKDAPKLEITAPTDGATFKKADQQISIIGKTEPDNIVTVNSFRAIVNSGGEFSYYLKLNEGENEIKVEAENDAGKKTEKKIKVTYKP